MFFPVRTRPPVGFVDVRVFKSSVAGIGPEDYGEDTVSFAVETGAKVAFRDRI